MSFFIPTPEYDWLRGHVLSESSVFHRQRRAEGNCHVITGFFLDK